MKLDYKLYILLDQIIRILMKRHLVVLSKNANMRNRMQMTGVREGEPEISLRGTAWD